MGDAFGSFLQGLEAGKQKTAAKRQAYLERQDELSERKRDQFNKDRTHDHKTQAQTQVVRGAAEDQIHRLEEQISAAGWDGSPEMVMGLMTAAEKIDRDYGTVLNRSVQEYFAKKLNLGGSNPQAEGKQGPTGPGGDSPLTGFTGPMQKNKVEEVVQKSMTKRVQGKVKKNALGFAMEAAKGPDNVVNPQEFSLYLLQYMTEQQASGNYDYDVIQGVYDDLADEAGPIVENLYLAMGGDPVVSREEKRLTSNAVKSFVNGAYGKQDSGDPFGMPMLEVDENGNTIPEDKSGYNMVMNTAQRMVNLGWDVPTIEIKLAERFIENGRWPDGNKATDNELAIAAGGAEFAFAVQRAMSAGGIDSRNVQVVYDEKTGQGGIMDLASGNLVGGAPGEWIYTKGSTMTYETAAPPSPEVEKMKPEEATREETAFKATDGTLKMDVNSGNEQVKAFFGGLKELDKKARYQTPETKKKLAEDARKYRSGGR